MIVSGNVQRIVWMFSFMSNVKIYHFKESFDMGGGIIDSSDSWLNKSKIELNGPLI